MNIVRTGVRSVWKRSWTFLGVKLQCFGSERVIHNFQGKRARFFFVFSTQSYDHSDDTAVSLLYLNRSTIV